MHLADWLKWVVSLSVVGALTVGGWLTRDHWKSWLLKEKPTAQIPEEEHGHEHADRLKLSPQAKSNVGLKLAPVELTTYWRTVQMPGAVVERAGRSNRGVSTTLAGIVTKITALPGDLVKPGDELFSLRLASEYLQNTQAQLFKTTRELEINTEEQKRLQNVPDSQVLFKNRLVELGYEERRLRAAFDTHRQDLLARGLSAEEVHQVIAGRFLTEIKVRVPVQHNEPEGSVYEMDELKVQLGELVQAGQLLAYLSNHDALDVEGKAFEQEVALLQQVAREAWPIQVIMLDHTADWPSTPVQLKIRFIASHVDSTSRLLSFFLPLENPVREIAVKEGSVRRVWRFRPGQRVRLGVPVERLDNVFVLPREAIVREGIEAFVFRANGDLLERKPVYVRYEDQDSFVLANDGSIAPGNVLAQNAAVALNRALKAQAESPAGHGHDHHGHEH